MTMDDEEDATAARQRSKEFREMLVEECPDGGFLFGNLGFEEN
jgi:hypothetical protein